MSTIPQGVFAVSKVRQNFAKKQQLTSSNCEQDKYGPQKYSSKLMMSIWGLYNRYSVHNFKKNTDADLQSQQTSSMNAQMFV